MKSPLDDLVRTKRLLVFVGEGGVGKTSCAAAAGLAGALAGRRVAVLTIDPAPRLGHALGLGQLSAEARDVPSEHTTPGTVTAMRLDTKGTFDRIVHRYATDERVARLVLENPIYQTLAGGVGGSEAFMALQRIDELVQENRYDLLVLDTPPAAHARDLLSAPSRLAALVETGAMDVLTNPALVLARTGSLMARTAAVVLLPLLERLTGVDLRRQVASFAEDITGILGGARQRADAVHRLLRQPDAAFVHVVRPGSPSVVAAIALQRSLLETGIVTPAIVVNRVTPSPGEGRDRPLAERLAGAPAGTIEAVAVMEADLDRLRMAERAAIAKLRTGLLDLPYPAPPDVIQSGALEHDIATLRDLRLLATALAPGSLH